MCAQKVKGFGQFLQRYNNIFANCKTAINGTSWCLTNEGRTDWKTVDYKNDIWKEVYPELYNLDVSKMGYVDQTDVSDGNYAFSAFAGRNIGISVQIGKSDSTSVIRFFGEKREVRLCVGIGKRCLRRHSTKTF